MMASVVEAGVAAHLIAVEGVVEGHMSEVEEEHAIGATGEVGEHAIAEGEMARVIVVEGEVVVAQSLSMEGAAQDDSTQAVEEGQSNLWEAMEVEECWQAARHGHMNDAQVLGCASEGEVGPGLCLEWEEGRNFVVQRREEERHV